MTTKSDLLTKVWLMRLDSQTLIGRVKYINKDTTVDFLDSSVREGLGNDTCTVTSVNVAFDTCSSFTDADIPLLKQAFDASYVHSIYAPGSTGPLFDIQKSDTEPVTDEQFTTSMQSTRKRERTLLSMTCSSDVLGRTHLSPRE